MRVQIAQLSGVMEIHLLIAIFGWVKKCKLGPGFLFRSTTEERAGHDVDWPE
jgi:hypothetical protein